MAQVLQLGDGLIALGHMHIHFVSVEIGVVGSAHTEIQPECGVGQYPHPMAHHAHSMQCGLPIEQHKVSILQAPLHNDSLIDLLSNLFFAVGEVEIERLELLLSAPGVSDRHND